MTQRIFAGRVGALTLLLFACTLVPSHAVEPGEMLKDPALESRARALSAGFRCLVCQNQSIDDSEAPLARDLRLLVRERLSAGDSDEEVRAFVVQRYGEFVLLRPPLSRHTLILWLTPLAVLLLAGGVVARKTMRRGPAKAAGGAGASALTPEEEARLDRLLDAGEGPPRG